MTRALIPSFALPLFVISVLAQQPTFKSSVDLVSVDVLVAAGDRPIAGLTASDFQILDNNVPQSVASISVGEIPLDVVLILDVSGSMAGNKLTNLVDASKNVLALLRPGDRVALVTFSQRTVVRRPLSSDIAVVMQEVEGLVAAGQTSLFDALYTGLSLRRTADTRQMVLLFSDGRDNTSWLSGKQIEQIVRESDVVVYAVGLDNGFKGDLQEIVQIAGGTVIVARSPNDLKPLFVRIVREMQARYVLTYYPTGVAQGGWHSIEVRVPERRANIVSRRGYWRR